MPTSTLAIFADPQVTATRRDDSTLLLRSSAPPGEHTRSMARLLFDGRLAEDFKLTSGTFVRVGELRLRLLAEAGVLSDAVIAGHDRDEVRALGWVNVSQARAVLGREDLVVLDDPELRAHLAAALARLDEGRGCASRVQGLLLLEEPPNIDAGEITDKAYVNQRVVLRRRADAVARLFAEPTDADVIVPTAGR